MREHGAIYGTVRGGGSTTIALESDEWRDDLGGVNCVVSSLVVHHLTDEGKRRLFLEAHQRMSEFGALMLIDCVQPQRDEGIRLYEDAYDNISKQQSIELSGDTALFDMFVEEEWNIFRHPEPSEMLAPLSHQLAWLEDAGFQGVDCFCLHAGYAVLGQGQGARRTGVLKRRWRGEDGMARLQGSELTSLF